jgi:putative ABC transport system permease protein
MRFTLTQMRHYARNYIAVSIAIVLGVAFVTSSIQTGRILDATTRNSVAVQYNGADVIVTSQNGQVADSALAAIGAVDGVATVERRPFLLADAQAGSRNQFSVVAPLPSAAPIRGALDLTGGRLPEAAGEVLLLSNAADHLQVDTGGTISLMPLSGTNTPDEPVSLTVVGIANGTNALAESNAPDMYGWPADVAAWVDPETSSSALITVAPGIEPQALVEAIYAQTGTDLVIRTHAQQVDWVMAEITEGTEVLSFGLISFAIIALFVAGIVIANTFAILVAQRSRNLALLRCVGATRRQIRRSVLIEAVILGAIASVTGVNAGLVLTTGGAQAFAAINPASRIATDAAVPLSAILAPFLLGFVATLIAAWGPANASTRVAPLAALRPPAALMHQQQFRGNLPRLLLTLLFLGTGSLLLVTGILLSMDSPGTMTLLIGVLGGMISFCGVLIGGVLIVPRVIAILGKLAARIGGAPAYVAASNSSRNPKRATSTAMALLIAVTLITMMSVGAATVKATLSQAIDDRNPIDVILTTQDEFSADHESAPPFQDAVLTEIEANPDVRLTVPVTATVAKISDYEVRVVGIDPDAARDVSRSPGQLAALARGTAIVPQWIANNEDLADGDSFRLQAGGRDVTLIVSLSGDADDIVVSSDDMKRLAPEAPVNTVWLRFDDEIDIGRAVGDLQDSLAPFDRLWLYGGANDKAANYEVLDTMLLIVTALLGVAVVIAVVGVGNTLSLSVIERTRESAILRAIGLTVRQLRLMLAIEGVLFALVGSVIGIVLGTLYGYAGAVSILSNAWGVTFTIPYGRIGLILAMAMLAGLVASVLPAQRAIRTSPVEALAE